MNLKERLTSTERLLRSIRGGEATPSRQGEGAAPCGQCSIWTRPLSLREVFASLGGRKPASSDPGARTTTAPEPAPAQGAQPLLANLPEQPRQANKEAATRVAPAPSQTKPPFWCRQIRLGGSCKAYCIGVSISGPSLCLAVIRQSTGVVEAARRFPMEPDQAPGEKGFPSLLQSSLKALGFASVNADFWAVLRSSDLDLNILAVPRLSGGKLNAAVYWTLQKEKKFAEAEYCLDYLPQGPTQDAKEPRLDVLTCLARKADVERLRDAFQEAGCALTGVTAIPNAFLALYHRPAAPAGYAMAANIHVEPDFSAIGLYAKDRLLFSRFIRSGAGSMAEALVDHFQALATPRPAPLADLELPLPGAPKPAAPDEHAQPEPPEPLNTDQAQELLRHVLLGAPKPAFATRQHLLSPEQMIKIVSPAIERLARQVERTLDYYASSQQARCDALHLSGEIFGCPAIAQALAGQLGFAPTPFDAAAILKAGEGQIAPADRMALAPALAAALAQPDKGVNLIANYKVRTVQEAKRLVTRSIILGLAGFMLLIGAAGMVLERSNAAKRKELDQLQDQAAALGALGDDEALKLKVERFKMRQLALRAASTRLLAPAALADLTLRTPENIRLLSLSVEYPPAEAANTPAPPPPGQAKPKAAAQPTNQGTLLIEGVVTGERSGFDAALSRLVLDLQTSPMLQMPVVNESGLKELGSGEQVLHFIMHVGVK